MTGSLCTILGDLGTFSAASPGVSSTWAMAEDEDLVESILINMYGRGQERLT